MRKTDRGVRMLLTLMALSGLGCGIHGADMERPTKLLPEPGRAPQFVLNQVGYHPAWPKVAFLLNAGEPSGQQVELVDADSTNTVLVLTPDPRVKDAITLDIIQSLDFTVFRQAGRYYLRYGDIHSYPFQIGTDLYATPLTTMLRSYYLQRCGVAVDDRMTGIYHPACYQGDGIVAHADPVHRAGERLMAQGGWHDAGDFGKYVATATVTIGRLLSLYEQFPHAFSDGQLHIPESGNGIPDLLDEVKVGLAWLLTMQRADGAVYRKLFGAQWPAPMAPEADTQQRFVYGISTLDTANFAQQCWQAALHAWSGDVALVLGASCSPWKDRTLAREGESYEAIPRQQVACSLSPCVALSPRSPMSPSMVFCQIRRRGV